MLSNIIRLIKVFTLTAKYARQVYRAKSHLSDPRSEIDKIKLEWARASLENLKVELQVLGHPVTSESMMFIGNHLSYLDIPVVMAFAPVSFVAKVELSKWPVIGDACRSVGTVFVKRESVESRKTVVTQIGEACLKEKQSICIFPSGTTSLLEDKPWRRGAFEIAKTHQLKIQPFRLSYFPRRVAAFVDEDAFIPHLWKLLKTQGVRVQIEFHSPVEVTDSQKACEQWQSWSREILELGETSKT
ncbi:MAG: lysophospholipid acyltransferase family protein [Deltaproteobacteria bacterium]